jgi:hypothetical protein
MALEADCGSSTVPEARRVASTAWPLVPGECRAAFRHLTTSRGPRDGTLRNSATPTVASGGRYELGAANPTSGIPRGGRVPHSCMDAQL